jgi:NifU-like protein involved in Fe-S cluster formation
MDKYLSSGDFMTIMDDPSQDGNKPKAIVGVCGVPGQGPHMVIVAHYLGTQIVDARFSTYGCPAAHACGQWITETIEDKQLSDASLISEDDIIRAIGQMPLGREHCPGLAIKALQDALSKIVNAGVDNPTPS